MMIYPPISPIVEKVGNKYVLVIMTAKRARQLQEGAPKRTNAKSDKPVTLAVNEIYENKISFVQNK